MINAKDIVQIFKSAEFIEDLAEMSSYAANIRQERPLVFLFAKYFWKKKHSLALEGRYSNNRKNKCDLVIDGTSVEFKSHLDCDLYRLDKETVKYSGDLGAWWRDVCENNRSKSFPVGPSIYKDIIEKCPDIFVWIICSRDLTEMDEDSLGRVVLSREQVKYSEISPFDLKGMRLGVAENFLNGLNQMRPFSFERATVPTRGDFPSAYHMFVCQFS